MGGGIIKSWIGAMVGACCCRWHNITMVSQLRTRCHCYAVADSWLQDVATSQYDGGVTLVASVYCASGTWMYSCMVA